MDVIEAKRVRVFGYVEMKGQKLVNRFEKGKVEKHQDWILLLLNC